MESNEYNKNQFVGILATDDEYRAATGYDNSVFINSQQDIQYQVKALSENAPARFFTGYVNSIVDGVERQLDAYGPDDERKAAFREKLRDYLFLFTTRTVPNSKLDGQKFNKVSRAYLVGRSATIKDTDTFITVPVFSPEADLNGWEARRLQRFYSNYAGFIEFLKAGKTIGQVEQYESSDCPKFIIWHDVDEGKFCAVGPFSSYQSTAFGGYILGFDSSLYEIDLEPYEDYVLFNPGINPTILHMVESVYERISNQFVTKEEAKLIYAKTSADRNDQPIPAKAEAEDEKIIEIDPTKRDDATFLQTFNRLCEENNLYYSPKDLTNIHTAIKTGNLVILSGMSGTGKSAVVDMYARALGLRNDDEDRVLIIPVRPSWNDDSDLLGYVDLIHMVYRASDTGFVKLLVDASKNENRDKLYVVCFDEMNLARVEHYFSQFLSILEKPAGKRTLRLYDEQYRGRLYNSSDYPDVIDLRDNIRFIGTVNIDESTYHFADKVLDRANVISLHVLPFNSWKKHRYTASTTKEWSYTEYNELRKDAVSSTLLKDFLWDFHQLLQETTGSMGIGPRVVKSIELFLNNLPMDIDEFTISTSEGVDIQVKQRILTKIRGSAEQFSQLFEGEDAVAKLFDKYSELSDFAESRKAVEQKKKELKVYGYCL